MKTHPKIALVHDFLREYGGAERVVEALHEMFPDAPLYTAFVDKESLGIHWKKFQSWNIIESWAASIPGIRFLYSPLRVLAANFFESFNFQEYDFVISSTNMYMAKAVKTKLPTKHLCYCHTPPRSLYGYTTMTDWKKNPITHVLGSLINHYMRIVDFNTAQRPTQIIANSQEVRRRIQKFYRRDSVVIYPPIDVPQTLPKKKKENFCLFVGRLAASKHVDLVVRACTSMRKKLIVVGSGKPLEYLQSIAGPTVTFTGSVDDATLHDLYNKASMLIYPAEDEDFGMIPVEAMAHGTPVIVHHSGGFLESVIEGKTGVFIRSFEEDELIRAIQRCENTAWDASALYEHAKMFSKQRFQQEILSLIKKI